MIVAVLASGPSMSQAVADSVRGRCKVVAVSDTWELAPWADALVSADANWWREKKPTFDGQKFTLGTVHDVEKLRDIPMGSNSGLLGIHVAVTKLLGMKILVLGVDLHGTHYFGPHTGKLKNTPPRRLAEFHRQFANYRPRGVQIFNCNPDSRLTCYPMARLEDHLEGMAEPAASGLGSSRGIHQGPETHGLRSRAGVHAKPRRSRRYGQLEPAQGGEAGGGGI